MYNFFLYLTLFIVEMKKKFFLSIKLNEGLILIYAIRYANRGNPTKIRNLNISLFGLYLFS